MYVLRYIDFNCRPVTKLGKDAYLAFCILFYSENCNESRTGGEGNATEDEQEFTANLPFFMVQYFPVNPGLLYSSLTFTTW